MQSHTGSQNCLVMLLRSRVFKVIFVLAFSSMFTAVYVNVFQHPPPDVILAMNGRGGGGGSFGSRPFGESQAWTEDEDEDLEGEAWELEEKVAVGSRTGTGKEDVGETIGKRSADKFKDDTGSSSSSKSHSGSSKRLKFADYWEKFAQKNKLVVIGAVYDQCENYRIQYGTVALMADKEFGGVKARTFVNITLAKEIDGGQFNIEVKYNGKDLYDNYWELCELEEELPPQNRTFNCPIAAGKQSKIKDRHIPGYLPKGRYYTKAWASDQDEKVFACGFADFTL